MIGAKELTHILVLQLNNNLLPNLLFSENRYFILLSTPNSVHSDTAHNAKLPAYTGGFTLAWFMSALKRKTPPFCSIAMFWFCFVFTTLLVSNNHTRASNFSKTYLQEILWLRGNFSFKMNLKAHPLGNVADQIQQLFTGEVDPYANNRRLSLFISLTGMQPGRASHTQTQLAH